MNKITLTERLAYRTYLIAQIGIFLILLAVLGWNGLGPIDVTILAVLLAASTIFYFMRRTRQTPGIPELNALNKQLRNGKKYTLVELYGVYCTGCVQLKPNVDRLEAEASDKIQVIRLNIETEPGLSLKHGRRVLTPTFQLYDPKGNLVKESYLVLDHAKIIYEAEQGTSSASN